MEANAGNQSGDQLPLVTIAIPTYNRASATLPQAISCALGQTYANIEVLVCDNCSTDHTQNYIESIDDARLRYLRHSRNIGANKNFNACLTNARGDYFLLFHDDDRIDPDFVECCITSVRGRRGVGLIRTGMRWIDDNNKTVFERENKVVGTQFRDLIEAWYRNTTTMYCCNTLICTKALRDVGGYSSKHNLFQDVLAQVHVAAQAGFGGTQEVKASFRRHEDNQGSSALIRNWCEDSEDLMNAISSIADPHERGKLLHLGEHFFSRMNYRRVATRSGLLSKLWSYFIVWWSFNRVEPVWPYLWDNDFRIRLRKIKNDLVEFTSTQLRLS